VTGYLRWNWEVFEATNTLKQHIA